MNRRLRSFFWIVIAAVALCRAWLYRYDLINDTVSYLDMGDQLFAGNIGGVVNGTWGPLYAVLLGLWLHLLHPSPQWEYPAIHALLVLLFFSCMASFDFFLGQLIAFKERLDRENGDSDSSHWARPLIAIGYVIFAWSALFVIGVEETNPDMIVAASFFVSSGLILRIHAGDKRPAMLVALGGSVGCGYLTKAVMLPIGCLLIAAAALAGPSARARLRLALMAGVTAGLLAAPQVLALSIQRGHFTTSETGRFNYAVAVQGVTYRHWQGETEGAGKPVHPTRQLLDSPAVFEFDGPLPGTYPLWFDPSYWYEGVINHFEWRRQLQRTKQNLRGVAGLFFALNGAPLALFILLQSIALRSRVALRYSSRFLIVLIPAIVALLPYVLVHYEPRYVGAFVCVLMTAGIASARMPSSEITGKIYTASAILVGAMFVVPWGPSPPFTTLLRGPAETRNLYFDVAAALRDAGYGSGTRVATLEYANMSSVMWARLARMKIVAEVYYRPDRPETNRNLFWASSVEGQRKALEALQLAGAKVVVTEETPRGPGNDRWIRLADGPYHYLPL